MDRLESMSTLLAAVEAGSLSAASRKLGMPLATVSRKVSELEAHLRTRLLNRTSRRLSLTDAGRAYVEACKRILEDIGEAERAATGEYLKPRGALSITVPIVFGRVHVLPVAIEFLLQVVRQALRVALFALSLQLQVLLRLWGQLITLQLLLNGLEIVLQFQQFVLSRLVPRFDVSRHLLEFVGVEHRLLDIDNRDFELGGCHCGQRREDKAHQTRANCQGTKHSYETPRDWKNTG